MKITSPSRNWDMRFLALADHVAMWSKDPSTRVGAVIVDHKRRVVGMGYNGFPRGVSDSLEDYDNREVKYRKIVHAEANAILNAVREIDGCTIYCTFAPCAACTALLIQKAIGRVVYLRNAAAEERWKRDMAISAEMFMEARVPMTAIDV